MKITRARKRLTDDLGADDRAIASNELPIGFVFEENLRNPGYHERINQAEQDSCPNHHKKGCDQMFLHTSSRYAKPILTMNMSISLIPTNGAIKPPTP
jgi:hypothetical protein